MVILTIRAADGSPIRIPLTKLNIQSVEINSEIVWKKPEPEPEPKTEEL